MKQGTLALHESTERAFSAFDLATRTGYRRFLAAQACAYVPLERAAERRGIAGLLEDWPLRRRADFLLRDLEALGLDVGRLAFAGERTDLDPLGIAYVLEGSRHGGRVLIAQAVAPGDPVVAQAASFLSHAAPAGWWRRFQAILDAQHGAGRLEDLMSGATGAFVEFEKSARRIAEHLEIEDEHRGADARA